MRLGIHWTVPIWYIITKVSHEAYPVVISGPYLTHPEALWTLSVFQNANLEVEYTIADIRFRSDFVEE